MLRGLKARPITPASVHGTGFQPSAFSTSATQGAALGWYGAGPLALCPPPLRRFLKFLPGRHKIELGGHRFASLRQPFRCFVKELDLDLSPGDGKLDARFAVGCALLALMKETARESG